MGLKRREAVKTSGTEETLVREIAELNKIRGRNKNLSAQQTIPFQDYKNGIFELEEKKDSKKKLRKNTKEQDLYKGKIYSVTFSFEDMNYNTLDPQMAEMKFNKWKDMLNTFPNDCCISLTIINQKKDIEKLKNEVHYGMKNDSFDYIRREWNKLMDRKIMEGQSFIERNRYLTLCLNADDIDRALRDFKKWEVSLTSSFNKIGTSIRRLSTLERGKVIHDILNAEKIEEFRPEDMDYLKMKKQGIGLCDLVVPDAFDFKPEQDKTGRTFVSGKRFGRGHYVSKYPAMLTDQILNVIAEQQFDCIITVSLLPESQDAAIELVRNKRLAINSMMIKKHKNAFKEGFSPELVDYNLSEEKTDADKLMDSLQSRNEKMFYVTLTIVHFADTYERLEEDARTLRRTLASKLCQLRVAQMEQDKVLKQSLPLGYNLLKDKRTCITNMVAAFMPFLSQEIFHRGGAYYGLNKISNNLIFINRWKLMNANGFIIGTSGAGKSFACKEEIAGLLLSSDAYIQVIDPDGEYAPFARLMGGEVIEISETSSQHINPMDMDIDYGIEEEGKRADPLIKKTDFIISLCEEAIKDDLVGISAVQRAFIGRCVGIVYRTLIEHNYDTRFTPTFLDLQAVFDQEADLEEEIHVAKAFTLFSKDSLSAFAHKTNVDVKNRFIVYDISNLGDSLASMGQLIMTDAVWNKVIENKKKGILTALISDEFTVMLRKKKSKTFFLDVYKRIRKLGGSATGITQNVTSVLSDKEASEMLANAEFVKILNQSPQDCEALQALYNLSDDQREYFENAEKGNGLIKAGKYFIPFVDEFPKDTELYKAMTTDPQERTLIEKGRF